LTERTTATSLPSTAAMTSSAADTTALSPASVPRRDTSRESTYMHACARGARSDRSDRGNRGDRGDRGNRGNRGDRGSEWMMTTHDPPGCVMELEGNVVSLSTSVRSITGKLNK
jgi:hypothetical protein